MLRHLLGLLAGIALAPVLWVGLAWSSETFPRIVEGDVGFATVSSVVVLCLLGGLGAYLVASRRSPMVAASSGVLLSALCLWPVLSRESLDSALSWLNDASFLYPNGTGLVVALPLGVLLAGSAFLPTRWRAADDLGPLPGTRVVASANRDRYRPAPMEEADGSGPEVSDGGPWNDGGPVGDTVPDVPPPASPRRGLDDPNKTTTPFRRGGSGAVWTPLDDDSEHTRILDDDRR